MASLIIFLVSSVTHFWKFGHPSSVVFDEVYFARFASYYWHGTYFVDGHPPFAKLFFALLGYITGVNGTAVDWSRIGNPLTEAALQLRFWPTLAGVLLPVIIYHICRNMDFSKTAALAAGLLISFENSLIVESRFVMVDSTMLLFGFLSILLYFLHRKYGDRIYLAASAVSLSLSMSTKWTALSFAAIIMVLEVRRNRNLRNMLKFIGTYFVAFLLIYLSVFAIHFSLIQDNSKGTTSMPVNFSSMSFARKFIQSNVAMYEWHKSIPNTHSYTSKWYTWPLMIRPVYYWNSEVNSNIYLLGNPLIYWLGTISIAYLMIRGILRALLNKNRGENEREKERFFLIIFGYLMSFLPFALMPRPMFLYHYETALIFSVLAIVFLIDQIRNERHKTITAMVMVLTAFLLYVHFSPLTYGTPLSKAELRNRMWISTWR